MGVRVPRGACFSRGATPLAVRSAAARTPPQHATTFAAAAQRRAHAGELRHAGHSCAAAHGGAAALRSARRTAPSSERRCGRGLRGGRAASPADAAVAQAHASTRAASWSPAARGGAACGDPRAARPPLRHKRLRRAPAPRARARRAAAAGADKRRQLEADTQAVRRGPASRPRAPRPRRSAISRAAAPRGFRLVMLPCWGEVWVCILYHQRRPLPCWGATCTTTGRCSDAQQLTFRFLPFLCSFSEPQ